MPTPNLFDFATNELSQDAFICWLASWADPGHRADDEALHATATAFLDRLLEVGRGPKVLEYRSIEVRRQWKSIDVLLLVNGDTAIIIEDKIDSKDHSGQLCRYREAVAREFPGYRIASVYLKTGDQCDYRSAEQAGYGCFLRRDLLEVLRRGEAAGVTNDIFADFHRHLRTIEQAVQGFSTVPLGKWGGEQWRGFLGRCGKPSGKVNGSIPDTAAAAHRPSGGTGGATSSFGSVGANWPLRSRWRTSRNARQSGSSGTGCSWRRTGKAGSRLSRLAASWGDE
jgi:hypothetical protein